MLLRFLGRGALIPLGTHDRKFHGSENWFARPGEVMERWWMQKYISTVAAPLIRGPRCLEWDHPVYAGNVLTGCTENFAFHYDAENSQLAGTDVRGDILNLDKILGEQKMDAIVFTQVLEHLPEPMEAIQTLFNATACGGVLIVTAPHLSQYHAVPHDYYRYTREGLKYMMVKAGYCVPNKYFAGGGDFVHDIARDAGMKTEDFAGEEMENAFDIGFDNISDSAIGLFALGFKPPHEACQDATSGKEELVRQGIWPTDGAH